MPNNTPFQDTPTHAALYDQTPEYTNRSDVAFYVDHCREADGKVLELGCGTGRVLIPAAAAGAEIVGLDVSPHMLAKCRENLAAQPEEVYSRVQLIEGSMTAFELGEEFALVIIPFRPFQHLITVEEQLACLRCIHQHLQPGGRLVFDVFHPNLDALTDPGRAEETQDQPETPLPDGRSLRRCHRFAAVHRAEQYIDIEIIYYLTDANGNTERKVLAFPFRYFFPYEVQHLLARTGFTLESLHGDYDRSALKDESPEMIFTALSTH